MTKRKNPFGGLISRLDMAKGKISEHKDTSMETSQTEMQTEKRMKKKKERENIQEVWDNYKRYNTCVMGLPENEERERSRRNMAGSFPKSRTDTKPQI